VCLCECVCVCRDRVCVRTMVMNMSEALMAKLDHHVSFVC